jgi:hypothetical protein
VGTASFISDAGHEMTTSVLPTLVTSTLHAGPGTLGAIEGVSDALMGLSKLAGGPLSDDPERRAKHPSGGYLGTAFARIVTGPDTRGARKLLAELPPLLASRAGGRLGRSGADLRVLGPGHGRQFVARRRCSVRATAARMAGARRSCARPFGLSGPCRRSMSASRSSTSMSCPSGPMVWSA